MARTLAWLATLLAAGLVVKAEPITVSTGTRSSGSRGDVEGWRPLRDSVKNYNRLMSSHSSFFASLEANKKHYRVEPSPSNKVEVFAPAPPTILGTFSGFGHDTVKSRHPVKLKKPYKESFQQAETRPGFISELGPPPYRQPFTQSNPYKHNDAYRTDLGHAYFFEASLSPPPRDSAINLVPPPSSKLLAPNSYYLQFDQHTRAKPIPSSYSPYIRQNSPLYGPPSHTADYFKSTLPSADPYRYYGSEHVTKVQFARPQNSHGRPPGIEYFGGNPFGDIHLNTKRPENKPFVDNKNPGKDVFEQLAHLGRPFQSSTIEPPIFSQPNEFSSISPLDYFTSVNGLRQTSPKPFRPSPMIYDSFTSERPNTFVTPEPTTREVYSIPVTTVDIPARDEVFSSKPSLQDSYQPIRQTQKYQQQITEKPIATTYLRRPEVELNTPGESSHSSTRPSHSSTRPNHSTEGSSPSSAGSIYTSTGLSHSSSGQSHNYAESSDSSTPFLPTPSTNTDPYIGEPVSMNLATPAPDTNEVQKPVRTRPSRPRYRKKKPIRKPYVETTSEQNFDLSTNQYNHEEERVKPTYPTLDTYEEHLKPTHQYEHKYSRRRPVRPNKYETISSNAQGQQDIQEIPTAFSQLPEDEIKATVPSSTTTTHKVQQRRRKKPAHRHRGSQRLSPRTTTTTEVPTEIASEMSTDYHTQKETQPTENYPISSLAFNEYGHVMQPNPDQYAKHAQIYKGNTHEYAINTQDYTRNTQDYIRNTPDYTKNTQDYTRNTQDYTRNTPDYTKDTQDYTRNTQDYTRNTQDYTVNTQEYNVNTLSPTPQIDDIQATVQDETTTTTEAATTTTTTTTTTTPAPETTLSTTTSRIRIRNKYNFNNTRPRFSVKDYRERLNRATSTTAAPKQEIDEHKESLKIKPPRTRGQYKHSDNNDENTETTTRRFKPRYTGIRHAYRTSTTTPSSLLQVDTPSTTERINTFKPSSQRRPGTGKYYSRYRTSTEPPVEAGEQPSTEKIPLRPKGVFSAKKRRPFPLRTRYETITKPTEEEPQTEGHQEALDNDLGSDQYITKKSDNMATTTLMTSSEEENWNVPSSVKPETFITDSVDQGDFTKKIADLTSSPSNSFDSSGFFKGVSPSSRRTVSQITLATEDPILPIEAFFHSSLNLRKSESESR